MSRILVRFSESERYDPLKDCEVVRFLATTDKGSYHTEVPLEGAKSLRTSRQAFKAAVEDCIRMGTQPCEVRL